MLVLRVPAIHNSLEDMSLNSLEVTSQEGLSYSISQEAFRVRPPRKLAFNTRLQATALISGKSRLHLLATVATPPSPPGTLKSPLATTPSPPATPKSPLATPPSHRLTLLDPQSLSLPRSLPTTKILSDF